MARAHRFARIAALALVACAGIASVAGPAGAADNAADRLVVQDVDLSNYPQVRLQVVVPSAMAEGERPVFSVRENGRDAEVLAASGDKVDQSVDAVLVLDTSGSMEGEALAAAKRAAGAFVAQLKPPSRAALVVFSDRPKLVMPATADAARLKGAIDRMEAGGETALYDAVLLGLRQVEKGGDAQPAVVVLSDGGDTASRASLTHTIAELRETGVPVLAVALPSDEADPEALGMLTRVNAGKVASIERLDDLTGYLSGLARELQTRYTVAYNGNRPATVDLDIEVTAAGSAGEALGDVVVKNPAAAYEGPLEETVEPVPPANPVTYVTAIVLVFASVAMLVAALALLLVRPATGLDQLAFYDQSAGDAEGADGAHPDRIMSGVMGALDYVAGKGGYKRLAYEQLERAGLPLRPTEYIGLHVSLVVGSGIVTELLSQQFAAAIAVVIIVTVLPLVWVSQRIERRRSDFETQLPDTLDLIAGSLRAGWGLQQAIEAVVDQCKPPMSEEFRRAQTEVRLGRSVDDALGSVAHRIQSTDFDWVVSAISIQREVGGNLAELLGIVANTIRERAALKRQVSALTAEGRFSAGILFVLPFFEAAILFLMNRAYISLLFTTAPGFVLLATGAALLVIGAIWLNRVIRVEV